MCSCLILLALAVAIEERRRTKVSDKKITDFDNVTEKIVFKLFFTSFQPKLKTP